MVTPPSAGPPPPTARVLTELERATAAGGAWLIGSNGQVLATTANRRVDVEATVVQVARSAASAPSTTVVAGVRFAVVAVVPDCAIVLVEGGRHPAGSVHAALSVAAAALAHVPTERPDELIAWLGAEPAPRSVFAVAIDELATITEAFGSSASDAVVETVRRRLEQWADGTARTADVAVAWVQPMLLAARTDIADTEMAHGRADALRALLAAPVPIADTAPNAPETVSRSVTVGLAVDERGRMSANDLVIAAQRALEAARAAGGDQVAVFVADKARRRNARLRLELELEDAIRGDQLRLHYQPEYDLRNGRIVAVEALLRWQHPRLGLLGADKFVPGTEHTHPFTAVQRWVVDQTCAQFDRWHHSGLASGLALRINAAAAQVLTGTISAALADARSTYDLPAGTVCIELTERMLPTDPESLQHLAAILHGWKQFDVRVAVDDFGTGQGTLTHLLDLPIDVLKLDQTYVRRVGDDARAHAVVARMVELADDLGIDTVVAEGVDGAGTAAVLLSLGVCHAQGHWLSPPRSAQTVSELLKAQQTRRFGGSGGSGGLDHPGVGTSDSGSIAMS